MDNRVLNILSKRTASNSFFFIPLSFLQVILQWKKWHLEKISLLDKRLLKK